MAYFANGVEGEYLEAQCRACPYGEQSCPIYAVQSIYNYEQTDNEKLREAMSVLVSPVGNCQMLKLIDPSSTSRMREEKSA
jgi:hypothetical protein